MNLSGKSEVPEFPPETVFQSPSKRKNKNKSKNKSSVVPSPFPCHIKLILSELKISKQPNVGFVGVKCDFLIEEQNRVFETQDSQYSDKSNSFHFKFDSNRNFGFYSLTGDGKRIVVKFEALCTNLTSLSAIGVATVPLLNTLQMSKETIFPPILIPIMLGHNRIGEAKVIIDTTAEGYLDDSASDDSDFSASPSPMMHRGGGSVSTRDPVTGRPTPSFSSPLPVYNLTSGLVSAVKNTVQQNNQQLQQQQSAVKVDQVTESIPLPLITTPDNVTTRKSTQQTAMLSTPPRNTTKNDNKTVETATSPAIIKARAQQATVGQQTPQTVVKNDATTKVISDDKETSTPNTTSTYYFGSPPMPHTVQNPITTNHHNNLGSASKLPSIEQHTLQVTPITNTTNNVNITQNNKIVRVTVGPLNTTKNDTKSTSKLPVNNNETKSTNDSFCAPCEPNNKLSGSAKGNKTSFGARQILKAEPGQQSDPTDDDTSSNNSNFRWMCIPLAIYFVVVVVMLSKKTQIDFKAHLSSLTPLPSDDFSSYFQRVIINNNRNNNINSDHLVVGSSDGVKEGDAKVHIRIEEGTSSTTTSTASSNLIQIQQTLRDQNTLFLRQNDSGSVRVQFRDEKDGLCLTGKKRFFSLGSGYLTFSECTDESWWTLSASPQNTSSGLQIKHHTGSCLCPTSYSRNTNTNNKVKLVTKRCDLCACKGGWDLLNGQLEKRMNSGAAVSGASRISDSMCLAKDDNKRAFLVPCEKDTYTILDETADVTADQIDKISSTSSFSSSSQITPIISTLSAVTTSVHTGRLPLVKREESGEWYAAVETVQIRSVIGVGDVV